MKRRVYIFTTFACTLRCPRCYQRQLNSPRDYMMSAQTFQRIIERVEAQNICEDEWVFTGGEPTLWPDLSWATKMVRQYRPKAKLRVVTNGYGCHIEDYGCADVIQVSDYGAINRMDIYRLRKEGRSRVKVQTAVHWDWDVNHKSELPGSCGCTGLAFVGSEVWPCAMAAAARTPDHMDIEDDFAALTDKSCAVHYQDLCRFCLVNRNNRLAPKPVVQLSLWEGKSAILG